MKHQKIFLVVGAACALAFIALPFTVSAHPQTPSLFGMPPGFWGPLVSCTGEVGASQCTTLCDLVHTFAHVLYFGISIVLFVLAPIMIAVGGIMILIAGANPSLLETGKKTVTAAVIGVVVVLGSFVIINTFFTLLGVAIPGYSWSNFQCRAVSALTPVALGPAGTPPADGGGGGGGATSTGQTCASGLYGWTGATPPSGTLTHQQARQLLTANGIGINKPNCRTCGMTGCTSLTGIPPAAINGVIAMKNNCMWCGRGVFVVTGGTETGHKTHRMGVATLDLRENDTLEKYIRQIIGVASPREFTYYTGSDGHRYYFEIDHWHVEF